MSVREQKEEILRLISRVNASMSGQASYPVASGSAKVARSMPGPRSISADHRRPARGGAVRGKESGHGGLRSRGWVRERHARAELGAADGELELLRRRRAELEKRLLDGGLLESIRRLEARLEAVERQLGQADSLTRASPEETATTRQNNGRGSTSGRHVAEEGGNGAGGLLQGAVLAGKLQEGLLADILQLIASNQMLGDFVVDDSHQNEFHLYVMEGQIFHAVGPGLTGEAAVYAAMAVDEGYFHFHQGGGLPEERTIESKTQFLILEALRQIDESRAGER